MGWAGRLRLGFSVEAHVDPCAVIILWNHCIHALNFVVVLGEKRDRPTTWWTSLMDCTRLETMGKCLFMSGCPWGEVTPGSVQKQGRSFSEVAALALLGSSSSPPQEGGGAWRSYS
jgi:hypothetical protein